MKRFIALLASALLCLGAPAASAADISITIDGEAFVPRNVSGDEVEPFIENGSTFLPVRAISEAVGKEVSYDAEQNAVYIGAPPAKEALEEIPSLKVGDRIFYESDTSKGYAKDSYVLIDRYIRLAESLFSEEEILLAAAEVRADSEDWMQNGVSESDILADYPLGTLEKMYYLEGCMKLLGTYNVGEPDESYYENYLTAKHILVETEEEANEVLSKLSEGRDFDELIVEYNTDPGQTKDSSYTFTYGEMVEEFEKAAFEIEEGKYTPESVKSQFGYHIIERLPLDREAVSLDKFRAAKLEAMLPEAGKVTEVTADGKYCGEIGGMKIPADLVRFVRGGGTDDRIRTLAGLIAFYDYVEKNGYLSELEKAAIEGELGNIPDRVVYYGMEISGESYRLLKRTEAIDALLGEKGTDLDSLYAEFAEYYKALEYKRYLDIRVFVDGNVIVPADVSGDYVAPKNIDGTVYVPVRAIVEALGMKADWDNDTRTVVIAK